MQNLLLDTKFIVHCSKFIVWRYGKNQSVVAILDYISKIKIYLFYIIFDDINGFLDPQNLLLHTKLTVLCTTVMELWEKISQRRPSWISQKLPGCCNDTLDFLELLVVFYYKMMRDSLDLKMHTGIPELLVQYVFNEISFHRIIILLVDMIIYNTLCVI